jgi:hypothetical protein
MDFQSAPGIALASVQVVIPALEEEASVGAVVKDLRQIGFT